MKRKIILTGLIVIIFFFPVFLIYKIVYKVKNKKIMDQVTLTLPTFKFYNLRHKPFTNDSLLQHVKIIIFYFNPNCEHCQYEAEELVKNADRLKKTLILFVSDAPDGDINKFDSVYHLSNYSFIKILNDYSNNFTKYFGHASVPTSIIYDIDRKIIKKFIGEVKIATIIDLINR